MWPRSPRQALLRKPEAEDRVWARADRKRARVLAAPIWHRLGSGGITRTARVLGGNGEERLGPGKASRLAGENSWLGALIVILGHEENVASLEDNPGRSYPGGKGKRKQITCIIDEGSIQRYEKKKGGEKKKTPAAKKTHPKMLLWSR